MSKMRLTRFLIGVFLPLAAVSAQPGFGGWHSFGDLRVDLQAQGRERGFQRREPPREIRPPERAPQGEQRPSGRLTEEERRALRRDIDRANREIYKGQQR